MKRSCSACGHTMGVLMDEGKQVPDYWYKLIGYIKSNNMGPDFEILACTKCGTLFIDIGK